MYLDTEPLAVSFGLGDVFDVTIFVFHPCMRSNGLRANEGSALDDSDELEESG